MSSVAKSVRQSKETRPDLFCRHPKCLWRVVTPRGFNNCAKHPELNRPSETPRCENCLRESAIRVEAWLPHYRTLVCGRCAVTIAERAALMGSTVRVTPVVMNQLSPWVASDGTYFREEAGASAHQKTLDSQATRYAERVARVIARLAAKVAA